MRPYPCTLPLSRVYSKEKNVPFSPKKEWVGKKSRWSKPERWAIFDRQTAKQQNPSFLMVPVGANDYSPWFQTDDYSPWIMGLYKKPTVSTVGYDGNSRCPRFKKYHPIT